MCVLKRSKNNDPLSDDGDEMGKGPEEEVFPGVGRRWSLAFTGVGRSELGK